MTELASASIPVHEIFGSTVQGEGFWAGALVDFIRLAGCPVGCPWCDTGYADGGKHTPRTSYSIEQIIQQVRSRRVVISGGEPLIHRQLAGLIQALGRKTEKVHIETSGAFWQELPDCWVTLSPKQHVSPRYPVQTHFWERANEIKIVISRGDEIDFYAQHLQSVRSPVYLQPEWTERDRTVPLTLELVKQNPDYRFSSQTHKYLNLP